MKRLFTISIITITITLSAQVVDNFNDGDFTLNPTWLGTTELFEIDDNNCLQIRNIDLTSTTQIAYLSTPSAAIVNAIWQCALEIDCTIDQNNFFRFYL